MFLGSIRTFLSAYLLVCLLVNFFGFRCLCGRFSCNATLSACYFIVSLPFVFLYGIGLEAYILSVGLSWYFFAYCVDYFRDGKSFYVCILMFFAIWQTNLNCAIFAFVGCVFLFVMYFDRHRVCGYIKLFVCVGLLLLYNVCDILYHIDALCFVPYTFSASPDGLWINRALLSLTPFGGYLFRLIQTTFVGGDLCTGLVQIPVFALCCYFVIKRWRLSSRRFKAVTTFLWVALVFGYVDGTYPVWGLINDVWSPFFQFPLRYIIFLCGALFVVFSHVVRKNRVVEVVLFLCVVDLLLANPLVARDSSGVTWDTVSVQLGNCEYAGKSFQGFGALESCSGVISESGILYDYVDGYNELTVDLLNNPGEDSILLPKLYYRGYKAYDDCGQVFEVRSGYSNFCQVDIGDYTGTLYLVYEPPMYLILFLVLQFSCLCCYIALAIRDAVRERKREIV